MAVAEPPVTGWQDRVSADDDDARRVFEALADEAYDFRTIQGIAESTGLSADRIQEAFEQYADLIRLSAVPGPNGEALYTLASRPVTAREQLALAQSVVASPVG